MVLATFRFWGHVNHFCIVSYRYWRSQTVPPPKGGDKCGVASRGAEINMLKTRDTEYPSPSNYGIWGASSGILYLSRSKMHLVHISASEKFAEKCLALESPARLLLAARLPLILSSKKSGICTALESNLWEHYESHYWLHAGYAVALS